MSLKAGLFKYSIVYALVSTSNGTDYSTEVNCVREILSDLQDKAVEI